MDPWELSSADRGIYFRAVGPLFRTSSDKETAARRNAGETKQSKTKLRENSAPPLVVKLGDNFLSLLEPHRQWRRQCMVNAQQRTGCAPSLFASTKC